MDPEKGCSRGPSAFEGTVPNAVGTLVSKLQNQAYSSMEMMPATKETAGKQLHSCFIVAVVVLEFVALKV